MVFGGSLANTVSKSTKFKKKYFFGKFLQVKDLIHLLKCKTESSRHSKHFGETEKLLGSSTVSDLLQQ